MSKKQLKDISSEALLNALNDEKLEVKSSSVYDFIERFDLKEGKSRVPARFLFNIFLKYYPTQLSFEQFNREARLLLKYDPIKTDYFLNKQTKLLHYEAVNPKKPTERSLPNSPSLQRHLNAWIEKQGIKKGTSGHPWFVVYDVYRNYCIDIKFRRPKVAYTFNTYLKFHFDYIMNDSGPVYLIDINKELLPKKEHYDKIKEKYKAANQKKSF